VLSGTTLQFNSERWSLKQLPIELQIPEMPIAIFTLKNRTISPVAQLFIEHARTLANSGLIT
jgi:hypothetical protein